jgi:hypothetical protein
MSCDSSEPWSSGRNVDFSLCCHITAPSAVQLPSYPISNEGSCQRTKAAGTPPGINNCPPINCRQEDTVLSKLTNLLHNFNSKLDLRVIKFSNTEDFYICFCFLNVPVQMRNCWSITVCPDLFYLI